LRQSAKGYNRVVVKIGASLLFAQDAGQDCFIYPMRELASQIAHLRREGREIAVVSSGAIAAGMRILKMKTRPRELASLQATAAVGQHLLMSQYQRFFKKRSLDCAQVLLTRDDFNIRKRYLNVKATLWQLFRSNIIPVINENDTVATEEIKFGDNDCLSAYTAELISADLLIILTDVDGLFDKEGKVIRIVPKITPAVRALACPTDKPSCVGGMVTKIDAARISTDAGIPCLIANGKKKNIIISSLRNPQLYGTFFPRRGARCR